MAFPGLYNEVRTYAQNLLLLYLRTYYTYWCTYYCIDVPTAPTTVPNARARTIPTAVQYVRLLKLIRIPTYIWCKPTCQTTRSLEVGSATNGQSWESGWNMYLGALDSPPEWRFGQKRYRKGLWNKSHNLEQLGGRSNKRFPSQDEPSEGGV